MEPLVALFPLFFLLLSLCCGGHSSCISGLPDFSNLDMTAQNVPGPLEVHDMEARIFPAVNFSCHGSILRWRLAAANISMGNARPEIYVWRRADINSRQFNAVSRQRMDSCIVDMLSRDDGTEIFIHENVPDVPLAFEPGDALGLLLTAMDVVSFIPFLRPQEGTVSYFVGRRGLPSSNSLTFSTSNSDTLIPVLALDICVNDTAGSGDVGEYPSCDGSLPPSPCRLLSSTTPTPSPSSSSSQLSMEELIIIIAVPSGLIVLALCLTIAIVVCCCVCRLGDADKHHSTTELAMDDIVPANGMNHVYEKPGPGLQPGHVVTNQLYERASDDDEGAPYEEPITLSQFGVPPELRLSGSDRFQGYSPPLPPPFARFNSPHTPITPISPAVFSQTTFAGRLSPHPPAPGSPAFYHTLERTTPTPGTGMRPGPSSRHRLRSLDNLDSTRDQAMLLQDNPLNRRTKSLENHIAPPPLPPHHPSTLPQHNYHTLERPSDYNIEQGVYVPTFEQRSQFTEEPIFDDTIYSCLSKAPNSPLVYNYSFFEETQLYWYPATDTPSLYQQLSNKKYREILRRQVVVTQHLGSGEFGTVCYSVWNSPKGALEVAVKMLNSKAGEKDTVRFLQEAAIMGQFRHPNIVRMHGVVTVGEPVMIVLELMKNGDLRNYLKALRPVPGEVVSSHLSQKLLDFCSQIALGMEYLARKEFIHRDLAARNILVTEDNVCKIGDFGLSRDLADDDYYISHGGKIPIKWTAPEALNYRKYSTASDVWSFAVLMFEIWSLGHSPFKRLSPEETMKLVERGHRLSPTPGCPRAIYQLMIDCWHPRASSRPSFTKVVQTLSQPDVVLLKWAVEDARVHPQASVLGAHPVDIGEKLYPELQRVYILEEEEEDGEGREEEEEAS